jgi:hypothetical protein
MRIESIWLGCKVTLALVLVVSFVAPIALGQEMICSVSGSVFQLRGSYTITEIDIFHAPGGQSGIAQLIDQSGNQYGPWKAKIAPDKWVVNPNVYLTAGSYRLVDSDPGTYQGQANIYGVGSGGDTPPPEPDGPGPWGRG